MSERDALSLEPAANGFLRADFIDANGDACSIQESSSATEPLLWLGQNSGTHHPTGKCLARMHLSQEHVRELLPLLQRFAETGALGAASRIPPRPNARWVPAHTDYSVCLVGGTFAAPHGGECDLWGGAVYGRRSAAQRECDRLNRRGRKDGGRFEVRPHRHKAGWSYHLMTICLGGGVAAEREAERQEGGGL